MREYLSATCRPILTMIASAQPISNFYLGPTVNPGAHVHTPQSLPMTRPTPNEVLALPHQLMSSGSAGDNGTVFGTLCIFARFHSRSALAVAVGWSLVLGDLKLLVQCDIDWRKGQISGKMQEMWTSFP